jgi:hypothetical protein
MRRGIWLALSIMVLLCSLSGCAGGQDDDVGKKKTAIPLEQVPAAVLKAAQEAAPDLTFFAAYKDTFKGQESIELKGKTKLGKIKELEMSPDGKLLGTE